MHKLSENQGKCDSRAVGECLGNSSKTPKIFSLQWISRDKQIIHKLKEAENCLFVIIISASNVAEHMTRLETKTTTPMISRVPRHQTASYLLIKKPSCWKWHAAPLIQSSWAVWNLHPTREPVYSEHMCKHVLDFFMSANWAGKGSKLPDQTSSQTNTFSTFSSASHHLCRFSMNQPTCANGHIRCNDQS